MSHRPIRDRATLVSYAQITTWAWFLYAFGAVNALLRDEQGTTRTVSALHGTMLAIGGLIGALLASHLTRRWGRGLVVRWGALVGVGGIALFSWPNAGVVTTLAGLFTASLFTGGFMLVTVNAFVADHQGAAGPSALTEANASASMAGLIGPVIVGIGAATFLSWRIGTIVTIVAFIVIEVWRGPHLSDYATLTTAAAERPHAPLPRKVYWAVAAVMCFVAAEFSMVLWSADLLRERCGFGPAAAATALAVVTGGMFVGRVSGSWLAQRMNTETMLRVSIVIALVGFVLAWAFLWTPIVLVGLFTVGLGISVHFPLGLARSLRASAGLTDRASGRTSAGASVGIAIAPFALGAMADAIGFHTAFLLVPALLGTALVIVLLRPIPDDVSGPRLVMTLE